MEKLVIHGLAGLLDVLPPWGITDESCRRSGNFGHERGSAGTLKYQMIIAVSLLIQYGDGTFHAPDCGLATPARLLWNSGGSILGSSMPAGRGMLINSSTVASTIPAPKSWPLTMFFPTASRSGS